MFDLKHIRRSVHYLLAALVMLAGLAPALAHDDFRDATHDREIGLFGVIDLNGKGDSKTNADSDHFFHCFTTSHLWISASVAQPSIPRGTDQHAIANHRLSAPFSLGPPTPPPNA